ncbi:MAG: Abi family protein [Lachnospiraceae bacterium]|nr:Abi family protein [Lachnospiraceae bacterium]
MKPYLTYGQQIQKLTGDKGLIISDHAYAERMLTDVGYFSLIGGYKNLFINPMTRKYVGGTTFEDIVALYRFDADLRQLTFQYLISVEQKLRQLISDSFCSYYGESQTAYLSPANYTQNPRKAAELAKLIQMLDYHADRNNEKAYLVHQRRVYGNVPLWVTTKILTFGQLSKFYGLLQHRQQSAISKAYENVSEKNLGKYLGCLTLFRNVCAHNERLFSHNLIQREFPDTQIHGKMKLPQNGNMYTMGKKDYFGLVIAFRYLLRRDEFILYKRELKKVIDGYCKKSKRLTKTELLGKMGLPANWETITRYKP